jgi:formylglycine-generating enzyme required for sulfatase activity
MPGENKKGIRTDRSGVGKTAPTGINHLLVIAIDEYERCPALNNCVKDAKDLIEILDSKYGISIDNNMLPPLFNGEATRENIIHSFRKLAEKVAPEDNVLIYFSGHGEYDSVFKQGYWVPVEGEKGKFSTYLPNSDVRVFLNAIKSHHTFIIVDSCFSGTLFTGKSANKSIERLEKDPSRWGLTSGRNEIVDDGEAGKNSPFAEGLLYRLRQNTGDLGVMQLCTMVLEQVVGEAMQTPRGEPLRVKGHKGGQFVFKLRKSSEVSEWEEASQSQSLDALLDFLDKYPQTRFKKEAMEKISYLEDYQDWQRASQRGKITDLLEYKGSHPKGRFIAEAEKQLSALRESRRDGDAWLKAQNEHSVRGYQRYLEEYPNGAYVQKATSEFQALQQKDKKKTDVEIKSKEKVEPSIKKIEESTLKKEEVHPKTPKSLEEVLERLEENMVFVKGGTFTMGCTGEQGGDCFEWEKPSHQVTVSDYYIGKYKVTQKEWREVMGNSPSYFDSCDNCPVEQVSWEDIQQFLSKLNAKTGKTYRLPTEAEWEYAARGGSSSRGYKYSGSNNLDEVAWHYGNSGSKTHPVGQKKANELGLYDMSGNVLEWCADWYGDYSADAQTNPKGPSMASSRVHRGGSWSYDARFCRVSDRFYNAPSYRDYYLGFRLAL